MYAIGSRPEKWLLRHSFLVWDVVSRSGIQDSSLGRDAYRMIVCGCWLNLRPHCLRRKLKIARTPLDLIR